MTRLPAVALLLVASLAGPARAAAAPTCLLVTDGTNDVFPVNSGLLDVVSADIASNAKQITGVIRVATDLKFDDRTWPVGRVYRLTFRGGKSPVYFSYVTTPTAHDAWYGHEAESQNAGYLGRATVKIVGNELRMTAPVSGFAKYGSFKPGATIGSISVWTQRLVGYYTQPEQYTQVAPKNADDAATSRTYVAGRSSCVRVGG